MNNDESMSYIVIHEPGCPAIADDESDYEHLDDAGMCVCSREIKKIELDNPSSGGSAGGGDSN